MAELIRRHVFASNHRKAYPKIHPKPHPKLSFESTSKGSTTLGFFQKASMFANVTVQMCKCGCNESEMLNCQPFSLLLGLSVWSPNELLRSITHPSTETESVCKQINQKTDCPRENGRETLAESVIGNFLLKTS